jgi:hypothetical protein
MIDKYVPGTNPTVSENSFVSNGKKQFLSHPGIEPETLSTRAQLEQINKPSDIANPFISKL